MFLSKVETADGSGQGQADLTLIGITDASGFRNQVLQKQDKVTENKYDEPESTEGTLQILKEIRDLLKTIEQKIGD